MGRWCAVLVLAVVGLAGCAEESQIEQPDTQTEGPAVEVTEDTGGIRGVVVDETITPVAGASVSFNEAGQTRETTSAEDGSFSFGKVTPGTYILSVTKINHEPAQTTVAVEAGVAEPDVIKVQLPKLFDQEPYMEQMPFAGFFNCAYNLGVSSTCVNDYTRVCSPDDAPVCCAGGCVPALSSLLDSREYMTPLESGWQTLIIEAIWESSLAGTGEELGMTVSFQAREGASHNWGSVGMEAPLYYRYDLQEGAEFPGEIPAEGIPDLFVFFSSGSFPSMSFQQDFEVFHTEFFYGVPPDGWSFLRGDGNPF